MSESALRIALSLKIREIGATTVFLPFLRAADCPKYGFPSTDFGFDGVLVDGDGAMSNGSG